METKLVAAEIATAAGVATVITNGNKTHVLSILQSFPASWKSLADSDPDSPAILVPPPSSSSGHDPSAVVPPHTLFLPKSCPTPAPQCWIANDLTPPGSVTIDEGTTKAFLDRRERAEGGKGEGGERLSADSVVGVKGKFTAFQPVRIDIRRSTKGGPDAGKRSRQTTTAEEEDSDPALPGMPSARSAVIFEEETVEVGRGLTNYNWQEISVLQGFKRYVLSSPRPLVDRSCIFPYSLFMQLEDRRYLGIHRVGACSREHHLVVAVLGKYMALRHSLYHGACRETITLPMVLLL